ncbi:fatty acid oxidation complex subunit alpha FadB [Gilvimarinus algae]|uniref:enoyl-CoA hydratase n=1 Tax=Gilvimarinus algae TaxID=3058037 RepID=A0ABT8TDW6_9GAMM|nr:fatty acid oxidation complex subunit alpha FadB [Gilvimarinus sp. SDUM040014]MDO3382312.1 fatty acid oxidation complex subunit alpha FadB [Gilvimarinus sp. SDUM040014]
MYQGNRIKVSVEGELAQLSFCAQASVNTFNTETVAELDAALTKLEHSNVKGLVIVSDLPTFLVGADINEFAPVFAGGESAIRAHLKKNIDNFNRLEALPFPVVIAINGIALGGGLELALACDFRVADTGARIGLPETKLGIIPGWGGTVRLPRIAGADTAIDWICSGAEHTASEALTAGVVDAVVEPEFLRDCAFDLLGQLITGARDYRERRARKLAPLSLNAIEAGLAFASSKGFVAAKAGRHYPAPVTAIDAMQQAASLGRDEALAVELAHFLQVAVGDTARALINVFTADQQLGKKVKSWAAQSPLQVQRAGVLGAGIMGGGIAYQSASRGVAVRLKDIDQRGIDLGLSEAASLLEKRVERGKMSTRDMAAALNRIEPTLSYANFGDVNLVVEAVVENQAVKQTVLAEVESVIDSDAVLASNTSTISISSLASRLKRPEKFCGMHFFNPVHAMPLVEVIRGDKTSDDTLAAVVSFAAALGKKPVVVNDCPGFLVNRVLFPYFAGFSLLVKDGVDYARIDAVMERWGWPMGPAYLLDVVGLDTAIHAEKVMAEGFPDRLQRDYPSALQILYDEKLYGQKTGSGFYRHEKDKKGKPVKADNEAARDLIGPLTNTDISDEDIVLRMMIPMVNELARCLEEAVVSSAGEADMAMIYGTGFPPHRGGVLHWVDHYGAESLVEGMSRFSSLGALYRPAPLLLEKASNHQFFYSR